MAAGNITLGRFQLSGIAPAPRGVPQIEVTFDIDANGIVNVSAKDMGTGKEQKITITSSTSLSEEEINQKVKEAEQYAAEDSKRKQEVEDRNKAENLIYETEKSLKELEGKIDENEKKEAEDAKEDLKKAQPFGQRQSIDKPRAPQVVVQGAGVFPQSQTILDDAGRGRQKIIGTFRAEQQEIDRAPVDAVLLKEAFSRRRREVGDLLVADDAPLRHAGLAVNFILRPGPELADQLRVVQNPLRKIYRYGHYSRLVTHSTSASIV